MSIKNDEPRQSIGLTGVQNARELGGYRTADGKEVKHGIFLRSAKLSTATEDDIKRLTDDYSLAKILDFRSDEEIYGSPMIKIFGSIGEPDPDPDIAGVSYIHLPIIDMTRMLEASEEVLSLVDDPSDFISLARVMLDKGIVGDNMYITFLEDELGKKNYARMFEEILSLGDGESILLHCTQGKDRTGLAAMLILSALDVDRDTITDDYMLTNLYCSERIREERKMIESSGAIPADIIDEFMIVMDQVSRDTMDNVLSHLNENYGSVKGYIRDALGLPESALAGMRDRFLS